MPSHDHGLLASFKFAWAGIVHTVRTQRNMRIHLAVALIVAILAIGLRLDSVRDAVLVVTMMIVLTSEMLNTVIEAAIDLSSPEYHPLARIAKDVAAGAVLTTAIGAAIVGLLILGPALWTLVF